jgi:hypothetical protein
MKYFRFKDLKAAGIVHNWTTLLRWIKEEGFPPGRYLGPNSRVWSQEEVAAWIKTRGSEKPKRAA